MNKIEFENMNAMSDIVETMSDGNELAEDICRQIIRKSCANACDCYGQQIFSVLDRLHIYGKRVVILWRDVCGEDAICMMALLRAYQLHLTGITEGKINDSIDYGAYIDKTMVREVMRKELS